ncbi:NDP-hexose 2,3-dehydratase family protein [Nocardiopsis sp. EMB25]|uniref:NDP-hexose 2,3-dehydratase family protein n=1 Tax=Nocardiopsis sp. EMB25 TaxID=2835867 RepID=UPI002284128D|nr:NDP-hexose 2,3-dehydratase family protein [Nocardiopsis sp. EMB25]MCY9787311.1 NDP-hexose 2,3-dehydratase family protein [Nocardiopsis sp. EMB25]
MLVDSAPSAGGPPSSSASRWRPAADRRDTARRVLTSAQTPDSRVTPSADIPAWLAERAAAGSFEVTPIPFAAMRGWHFEGGTGNLRHASGRFFSVEGLHVRGSRAPEGGWRQPIIVQPEVGLLGIVAREIDGVLHFLMQTKMEPGNVNTLQISPTVQATRSNFTGVHRGRGIRFLDLFLAPGRCRVLVDVLQSEQADWFLAKRNRNMVVEVAPDEELDTGEDFRWLTLGQIRALLTTDNLVNMDARSIVACLPTLGGGGERGAGDGFTAALLRSFTEPSARSLRTDEEIGSWFNGIRALEELVQRLVPLDSVDGDGWEHTPEEIAHGSGRHFRVLAADVTATSREVSSWSQPLIQPRHPGLLALLVKRVDGVLHALVQARVDVGHLNVAELAPTVHCRPAEHTGPDAVPHPPYLDLVLHAPAARLRYDAVQSEEGGRFFHAQNRYTIVEVPEDFDEAAAARGTTGGDYAWVTFAQLTELLAHGNYVNVELRTLIACAHALY